MATTTLLTVFRTRAAQKANIENVAEFVDQTTLGGELDTYINESVKTWWDLIHRHADFPFDLQISSISATGLDATSGYSLPSDFYRMHRVEAVSGNTHYELHPAGPHSLREFDGARLSESLTRLNTPKYWLFSEQAVDAVSQNYLVITPRSWTGTLQVYYIPTAPTLSLTSHWLDSFNGLEEWIVLDVAMKILEKEEVDTTALERRRDREEERLISAINARNGTWAGEVGLVETFDDAWWV